MTTITATTPWAEAYDAELTRLLIDQRDTWAHTGIDRLREFIGKITPPLDGSEYNAIHELAWESERLVFDCVARRTSAVLHAYLSDDDDARKSPDKIVDIIIDDLERQRDTAVTVSTTGLFHEAVDRAKGRAAMDMLRQVERFRGRARYAADRVVAADQYAALDMHSRERREAERKRDNARTDRSRQSWQAVVDAHTITIDALKDEITDAVTAAGRMAAP